MKLAALPKAHLHVHLDGAMRRSTLLELAERAGVVATLPSGYGSFAAFTDTITEYTRARDGLGLTAAQLATCARTSLRHSGAPRDLVESALAGIDAWRC